MLLHIQENFYLVFLTNSKTLKFAPAVLKMSNLRDFVQGEAELGSESEDEDFDEKTGETRSKPNGARRNFEDSSEEEEEDDEEEEQRVKMLTLYTRVSCNVLTYP